MGVKFVAKRRNNPPPHPGDEPGGGGEGGAAGAERQTNVKCYVRVARKITQLASLLDVNQADILAQYEKPITDALLAEMARRASEIRGETG